MTRRKKVTVLTVAVSLFVALSTTGFICNEADVPTSFNQCDIGATCTAGTGGGSRTCKYNLGNREFHETHVGVAGIVAHNFVLTSWCSRQAVGASQITSRRSTPQENITREGIGLGWYYNYKIWWSSDCYPGATNQPNWNCLTRREISMRNGPYERNEQVCIGTRIYANLSHHRNISETHGCPGDAGVSATAARAEDQRSAHERGMAVYRAFPRRNRLAIRRACAASMKDPGVSLSVRCAEVVKAAYATLEPERKRRLLKIARSSSL